MDPDQASCRPAPASRPPATGLLGPAAPPPTDQPELPLAAAEAAALEPPLDPALRQAAISVTAALVEVLAGQRPESQLEGWAEPELRSLLGHLRRAGRGLRLRSVRVQLPGPGALEVSAHLVQGGASRAAALRLEHRRGRWLASQLAIALRPGVVSQAGLLRRLAD